jgi:hypothetical protein
MKKQTLEQNAAALKRWRSRLKRAMSMLDKLEKQRKRLEASAVRSSVPAHPTVDSEATLGALPPKPEPLALTIMREIAAPVEDTGIPAFLQRKKLDPVAEEIAAEQADLKKRKAKGRIEKMKAKQRGDLKKMPLTGKAALAAIRGA